MDRTEADALERARAIHDDLSAWRRQLHAHPELAFQEAGTAATLRGFLEDLGVRPSAPMAGTGFAGTVPGRVPGPTVALRADMDALPIQEANDAPYASVHPGVAHLCGHDAHCAMLVGAAKLLADDPPARGAVRLLFQPAEEEGGGAERMIEDGALESPEPGAIFALHVDPSVDVGRIALRNGPVHASVGDFDLVVRGEGGHAAKPHQAVDAVAVAGQVITALQQLASRAADPVHPFVLTIGTVEGGFARNVIAPEVRLSGTVRTFDPRQREAAPEWIRRCAEGVAGAFGARIELEYRHGYPATVNDASLRPWAEGVAASLLGGDRVEEAPTSMGGEDFAYYGRVVPAFIGRLGVRNEGRGLVHPLHHPKFDLDEEALPIGAAWLAGVARRWLDDAAA